MIDISLFLRTTTREVESRDHLGKPVRVAHVTRVYETNLADAWDCLTSPERISRWFLPVSGDLKVGGRFQLTGNAAGEIVHCAPPSHLMVTWEGGGSTSWVAVTLTRLSNDRTRLSLEHMTPVGDPIWEQFGPGAVGVGWDMALMGLFRHLDTKHNVDPAEAVKWSASDEGKQFLSQCSENWGRAAIASGDCEDRAKAAAQKTRAFYTGIHPPAKTK